MVRLLQPLAEHDLPAGSRGTVVMDYSKYSGGEPTTAYEVEFVAVDGTTQAIATVPGELLEVVKK
ncbi:MAG: DUF4926 domain-containing protein [Mycolicibacterium cosmeticum]|nr:DUF4926 domain-containing protein [Mycolicibacterium cosmeticum]